MNELESKENKQDTAKGTNAHSVSLKAWLACTALPKPYYEDESVALFCDDCTRVLPLIPANSVDLVLTDPPYNVGKQYDRHLDEMKEYENWCKQWFEMLLEKTGFVSLSVGTKNLPMWYRIKEPSWLFAWYKGNAILSSKMAQICDWEPFLIYGNKKIPKDAYKVAVFPQVDTGEHPCPKPISLISKMVRDWTSEEGIILEQFCGSGTTLVAAKRLNRKAIGIEISEKYCEIAVNRLRQQELFSGAS